MFKKLLSSRKAEGYIDMCVGVVVFVMILVIAINIFSFITLKVEMDQIAEDLIVTIRWHICINNLENIV